jgi:hypothetical protein
MTTQLARRSFFRGAGVAAAGVLAAPVLDLGLIAGAATPDTSIKELLPSGGDDTAAIRAALDSTGSALLGPGTFKVSSVQLRSGQHLVMSMRTILQPIAGSRPVDLLSVNDGDDVRVEGGVLDGAGAGNVKGIGIYGGNRVLVLGTRAMNMSGYACSVGTSFARTSAGVVFRGVSAARTYGGGILVNAAQRVEIVDCEIVDSGGGPGVALMPSGPWDVISQVSVRGCELARNQHGVRAAAPTANALGAVAVVNNNIHSNRETGILASPGNKDGFLVDGNVVVANGTDGVSVDNSPNGARIVDNEIRDNGGAGVRLRACQRWEVRGNHIARQRGAGVVVHSGTASKGASFGLISQNQIWDNSAGAAKAEPAIRIEGAVNQKPTISVTGNWYGNLDPALTQRVGVLHVGRYDKTTVRITNNQVSGHSEIGAI